MTPIVEHKNGDLRSVRDDVAQEYVACVPCRGMGSVSRCIGHIGNLWYDGWQIYAFGRSWCGCCDGLGIWRKPQPSPIATAESEQP